MNVFDEACQRQVKLHERVCSGSCRCDNGACECVLLPGWLMKADRTFCPPALSDNTEKEEHIRMLQYISHWEIHKWRTLTHAAVHRLSGSRQCLQGES